MPSLLNAFPAVVGGLRSSARAITLALCLVVLPPCAAGVMAQPGESVTFVNAEGVVVAELDREALEAIGRFTVRTRTPWDDDVVRFEGPLLRDLNAALGFGDAGIAVKALNAYSSEIPFADMRDIDVILAVRKNGEQMSVAEKGPAFIVYPYDSDLRLRDRVYYARSVWQVSHIRQIPSSER